MNERILEAGLTARNYWTDLWRYRELFYFLVWRDLLVRYKQTTVGVAWSLLRPVLTMFVLTLVFGKFGKTPTGDVPTALMVFCGLLPWTFFSTALSESGQSLVTSSNLISKIYFPRLVIPAASVMTSLVDFAISVVFLLILLVWYRFVPSPNAVFLPLFTLLAFGLSFGAGLWISALMVKYRDFRFIVPFVLQFGLYLSPVGYVTGLSVPEQYRLWFSFNPVVGIIDGFRWALLGGAHTLNVPGLIISIAAVGVLVVTGIWHFRKTERSFADII